MFEVDSTDIMKIRDMAEVYDSVEGIRKSFGYMALGDGRVLQQWFDCWCPACMSASGPGVGLQHNGEENTMDSNYQVSGCSYAGPWWECPVQLHGPKGIAAQRKATH